jgi:hypothetical protein
MSTKTRVAMSLTSSEKADWISQFNTKKSFPSKQVPCSCCNAGVTMFGPNLRNRVERFESVEDFLNNFVCRTCKGKKRRGENIESAAPASQDVEDNLDETIQEDIKSFDDSEGYVVEEPADETDDQTLEEDDETVEEEITAEDSLEEETETEVFDDSEEHEEEGGEVTVDVQALREKYKAFYSMRAN